MEKLALARVEHLAGQVSRRVIFLDILRVGRLAGRMTRRSRAYMQRIIGSRAVY